MGDGRDLVAFFSSVLRGDADALGEHRITLRDRLQAAEWLADRGWGTAPLIVEIPEPRPEDDIAWRISERQMDQLSDETRRRVVDMMSTIHKELQRLRIGAVEARMLASMPKGHRRIGDRR